VPLTSVLYVLAIASFLTAAYYGFRLSRITKVNITIMMTQDGPVSILRGIVLLALSQILKLIEMFTPSFYMNFFDLSSSILLLASGVILAIGFEKMYSGYNNERIRTSVYNTLEELGRADIEGERKSNWQASLR
jgi:membrane-bound ClpP family serine protease